MSKNSKTLINGLPALRRIIFMLLIIIAIQTIAFAESSSQTQGTATIDVSLSFPPVATIRMWLDNKHGFEFYPANQFQVMGVTGYYLRYMYKFYNDYYLGIGCLGGANSSGQTAVVGWFGTFGSEFNLYYDWLIMDLGLAYFPTVPSLYSLWPTAQLGVRFKI
jgi:hypothetical protein